MRTASRILLVVAAALAVSGCGGTTWVRVPPAIDLARHEIMGVIDFSSSSKGNLADYSTQVFIEEMRADQGMIRIVELGTLDELRATEGLTYLDRAAYQAIGERHGLTTIVVGKLDVSNVKPAVSLSGGFSGISAAADVDARLSVQMIDAKSGASIWSRSADATRRVGHVSVLSGGVDFDADDPDRAYGDLVRYLAKATTADFKATWEKRKK